MEVIKKMKSTLRTFILFSFLFCFSGKIHASEKIKRKTSREKILNPIHFKRAFDKNDLETIKKFLKGKDIEKIKLVNGFSPLCYATKIGNKEIISYLLENYTYKIPKKTKDQALCLSVEKNSPEILKLLIFYWLDVDARNKQGEPILFFAVRNGYRECAKILVLAYATLSFVDRKERTVLHLAAARGYTDCVEIFLQCGAELKKKDHKGHKAIDKASRKGYKETKSLLKEWSESLNYLKGPHR